MTEEPVLVLFLYFQTSFAAKTNNNKFNYISVALAAPQTIFQCCVQFSVCSLEKNVCGLKSWLPVEELV